MGVKDVWKFLYTHYPRLIQEPIDFMDSQWDKCVLIVDAFPLFWRVWCSSEGGVRDRSEHNAVHAAALLRSIIVQWTRDYQFQVVFVLDPALASVFKRPEQQRRIRDRAINQGRVRDIIRLYRRNLLGAAHVANIEERAASQGYDSTMIMQYLRKRQRQTRFFTQAVMDRFIQVLDETGVPYITAPNTIEGEMYCCQLADALAWAESRRPLRRRQRVLLFSSDTDVLAYDNHTADNHPSNDWTWLSIVLPNQANPRNADYNWQDLSAEPNADLAGVWRAIDRRAISRALHLTKNEIVDWFILSHNSYPATKLHGMSITKAFDLISHYRSLEEIHADRFNLPFYQYSATNRRHWGYIIRFRASLRRLFSPT